jgi:hypothetical protein
MACMLRLKIILLLSAVLITLNVICTMCGVYPLLLPC